MALTLDPSPHPEPEGLPQREALRAVPRPATGLELVGELDSSGYEEPPWLVRRADGQVLQLTPALYAVLEAVDGRRDLEAISAEVRERRDLDIDPEDIGFLVTDRLMPLGVLLQPDGSEPATKRANPLLGLRGRVKAVDPERTNRLATRFEPLFNPVVVALTTVTFLAASWYVFVTEGLGAALRDLFHQPGALLAVIALTVISAAFHEVGHAAACRYGGARPGVMGAGLYLLWPAFYTDVSDSYRLPRAGRLRVDLGGLYFNAVFGVGTFLVWAGTRWDPLLVLFVLQLFQMARQLAPLLRFDGYHVLADLVGVPDLYARIGPVLRGMLPWRRQEQATALRPWARGVITAWVILVAPILLFSLLVMVVMFPRLAATAAASIGERWASLRDHWAGADLAPMLLDALAIVTIALPVAGVAYLLVRMARRAGTKAWRATEDNRRARGGLVLGAASLAVALTAMWWPQGQYRPISEDEHLTLPAISGWLADAATGDLDLGADGGASGSVADAELVSSIHSDVQEADAPSPTSGPAGGHVFPDPPAPGPGDNQAVAIGYDDGRTVTDTATSLEWESSGEPVDNRNEAYALASCRGCRTMSAAFQVVLVVGQHSTQAPANKAVAINEQCVLCTTRALAVQLVLPLEEAPDAATKAEVESIFARSGALDSTLRSGGIGAARALLSDIEHDLAAALELDDELAALTTTTTQAPTEITAGAGDTTTTTASVTSTTAASEPTTTAPSTTTTGPSTTTTEPPTTESTAPPP